MTLEYDLDVGALYIRLSGQRISRTREFGGNANVDLDDQGQVVGIEVISAASRWPLDEILTATDLQHADAAQLRAYFGFPADGVSTAPRAQEPLPVVRAEPTPPERVAIPV